jgi:hypothetical protein
VVAYQYRDANGRVDQCAVTYLRKDSYLQSTTSGQNISNTPNVRPVNDESVYDPRGNLVALAQHTQYGTLECWPKRSRHSMILIETSTNEQTSFAKDALIY